MRKLLLAAISGLFIAGGLTGCHATSGAAAHTTTTMSHAVKSLDNFGEVL